MTRRTLLGIASAAAFSVSMAQAAEPVRQIGIYVQPYYEAAREPGGTPRVAVGAKGLDWVEKNPYEAMFMERLPAKSSNRRQALVKAHALIRDNAAKERAYLQDPANVAKLNAVRAANGADDKYCWK